MTDRIAATPIPQHPRDTAQAGQAIARAAERTGVDFRYLLAQAQLESGMDPRAKASSSSATGLFQFIDQTWLAVLDRHGERLGLGNLAQAIETTDGRSRVTDPAMRQQILDLRFDPTASSLMAAALASDNGAALEATLGREPDPSELYLAHFLGVAGANRFLGELASNPNGSAVELLPRAARSNPAIFRDPSGAPRSVGEVMEVIRRRVDRAMGQPAADPASFAFAASTPQSRFAAAAQETAPLLRSPAPRGAMESGRPSMAETLREGFLVGEQLAAGLPGQHHIRAAYAQLKVFDL